MEWNELAEQLSGAGLAHIATASADGRPHQAMVSAVVEGDHLWIFTTRGTGKARNLRANPRIAIMWNPQAEIYLDGDVEIIDDVGEKERIWSSGLLPYDPVGFFGTPENPELVLLKVSPTSAQVVSMGPTGISRSRWHR